MIEDNADPTGERRRVGHDPVGPERQVIGPRCGHVHQAGDHGPPRRSLEAVELLRQDVAGRDPSPGAMDPQHDRRDPPVAGRGLELLTEGRDRILAGIVDPFSVLVQEHPVHVDHGEPGSEVGAPAPSRPDYRRHHRTRVDGRGKLDRHLPPDVRLGGHIRGPLEMAHYRDRMLAPAHEQEGHHEHRQEIPTLRTANGMSLPKGEAGVMKSWC